MAGKRFLTALTWVLMLAPALGFSRTDVGQRRNGEFICGTSAERERNALARGKYQESRLHAKTGLRRELAITPQAEAPNDIGDVAVIEDDGTLVTEPNVFNLSTHSFRFVPAGSDSYKVESTNTPFSPSGGRTIPLGDDDSSLQELGFNFSFYGQTYTSVYLNSDGNLTFTKSDTATSDRDLGRFASGPPRIGPFFSDLDPSLRGAVTVRNDSDGILFSWNSVPAYQDAPLELLLNSFSVKLARTGAIEFVFGTTAKPDAIVGISPGGGAGGIAFVDFTRDLPTPALGGTITEVFSSVAFISETGVARKFFQTHPDSFDHLNLFLGFPFDLGGNAFAYELNVRNEVTGINLEVLDHSEFYGSKGRLRSFLNMGTLDGIGRYPNDPNQIFLGTNNTIDIMGQESGHRWLAFTPFRDGGINSDTILGRDFAHWSFFFDSDASVMEGNDIRDDGPEQGNRRFTTVGATSTYSLLDQYLMGLVGMDAVPNSFVVENPTGTFWLPSSAPRIGVSFGGTRKDVLIDSIVSANGNRLPSVYQAPKVFRQAFILLIPRGQKATPEQIHKVQAIRNAWVTFFNQQTDGRGWVVTNLQESPSTTPNSLLFPYFQGSSDRYTGIALANWGSTPTDVTFTAYENSGNPMSSPTNIINPRVVTIAPQSQVALLGEQIHGLAAGDPHNGWIRADTGSSQVSGFFLEGDFDQTFLAGAVATNRVATTLYFTRAQWGTGLVRNVPYKNLIVVANPSPAADAQLFFQLFDESGTRQGTALRSLNPRGRLSEDLASLFPGILQPGTKGYLELTSSVGVVGYQAIDSGTSLFSLPAQPVSDAGILYSAQFASGSANGTLYFTDVNLINTATQARQIKIEVIGNNGFPVAGIRNPINILLESGAQYRARGEAIFSLPDAASAPPLVVGSLVITADGAGVLGDVIFGDPLEERFHAGLPLDGSPYGNFILSQVAQGAAGGSKPYFTGIALYNPNVGDVEVNLDVYSATGEITGTATFSMPRGSRVSKTLPEFVPELTTQVRGYLRIRSTGGPLIAFELFGDEGLTFLSPVPPQPINP